MTWSLVLGGAQNVYDDLRAAIDTFGEPRLVIAAKDIWITYPRVDYVVSFHSERLPAECARRQALGLPLPAKAFIWGLAKPPELPFEVAPVYVQGGSSGLMATMVATRLCSKVIIAGIPNDPTMKHFHDGRGNKPWVQAETFKLNWQGHYPELKDRVKSMSGWTQQLLGAPTHEWLAEPPLLRLPWPEYFPLERAKPTAPNRAGTMIQLALKRHQV